MPLFLINGPESFGNGITLLDKRVLRSRFLGTQKDLLIVTTPRV